MTTVTLTTSITRLLPSNRSNTKKRWFIIQNQSGTKVGLQLDGNYDPNNLLTSTNCYVLEPAGTPGDTLAVSSTVPNGTEAENFVDAIGFSGGEKVNVQTGFFNNQ